MPTKTNLNIELFNKIKKHIKARPARLRMDNWIRKGTPRDTFYASTPGYGEPDSFKFPTCGTVGCIAGWAFVLNRPDEVQNITPSEFKASVNVASYAAGDLGILSNYKPFDLFYVDYWPNPYRDNYRDAKTQRERVKIVCEVIDEFIRQYQMMEEELNARKA